jgi:RNA polymerase sigma-70 factor (ECF subfamily)
VDAPAAATASATAGLDDAGWQQLCRAIRRGDERAFERFYDLWFARAQALARAVTRGDEATGLDVVQDVMLKVVHKLPALASERAVASWMAKTISASAIDRCRSEQRRRRREQAVAAVRGEAVGDGMVDELHIAEQIVWLRSQLLALSQGERLLLQQRLLGERSLAQVGEALGLTSDAVHGRTRRLLLRLQRAAREWFGDG